MIGRSIHPNTKVLLDAWQRMSANPGDHAAYGPRASEHPGLIGSLFVLQEDEDNAWSFRTAGDAMTALLGRDLTDHDFLDLWTGPDRAMTTAFLQSIRADGTPGVLRGRGETLTGQRVEIEISLAPLPRKETGETRILGLYQTLGGEPLLKGRPIWRHRITMLAPPDSKIEPPRLRLVTDND